MIKLRKSNDRGVAELGWLSSRHTFSFGHYQDPKHLGFGNLIVINEDKVQPSQGFANHGHRDMEIITYVLSGALAHKDSLGTGSVIRPGDVQKMSAGTGIKHSEFNASDTELVHFLQIWVVPDRKGIAPSYEQRFFPPDSKEGKFLLIGSKDGRNDSIPIVQDVDLFVTILAPNQSLDYEITPHRMVWIQIVKGGLLLNSTYPLQEGDGVGITAESHLDFVGTERCEFLLFDMSDATSLGNS